MTDAVRDKLYIYTYTLFMFYWKVPATRVLSSPSGGAAEDNVEERENSEVTQFFDRRGTGTGTTDGRRRTTDGRTDRIFLANIVLDVRFR